MNITLNMRQRISIEGLLSQVAGKGSEMYTRFDIYKKVQIPDRDKYVLEGPNGMARVLEKAVDDAPSIDVEFSLGELKALEKLLNDCDITAIQMVWWVPLMKQIDAAIKAA